jgi:hypothetical protein
MKDKERKNAKIVKDMDNFTFAMQHGACLRSACKGIMDPRATKHMTLHRAAFDTYKVISPHNVHLDDNSVAKAIGRGSIVVEIE